MTERDLTSAEHTPDFLGAGIGAKRAGLTAGLRAVYQVVLRAFAATGRPPGPGLLEDSARLGGLTVAQALADLAAADVVGLDGEGRIRMAYPFSAAPTPHVVAIAGGTQVHAMCAIDALGIPPMLGTDAVVTSADPLTGAPVTVTFRSGRASWHPDAAVVFIGRTDREGPSELVSCGCLNFFTDAAAAAQWAGQHPEVTGSVLDHARAEALGSEIFGSLLMAGT
jgi:Alkylmercury lyase